MEKICVGILGATGLVGQTYANLLDNHPFFKVVFLAASDRFVGYFYKEALFGRQKYSLSDSILEHKMESMTSVKRAATCCRLVFSALQSDVASKYEPLFAQAGMGVFSHAAYHRQMSDIPLIIPEINPDHLFLIPIQQKKRGWDKGFILAKPNCSLQSYLLPLYPLHRLFKLKKALVTMLQSVSGGGSHCRLDNNIVPYIEGEELKSEGEPLKILGRIQGNQIKLAKQIRFSVHCNRVPVQEGHLACIAAEFQKKPSLDEMIDAWNTFTALPQKLNLPFAPKHPTIYIPERDRPQPQFDLKEGMSVIVGRLRDCPVLGMRFTALSHNLIRGAAGGMILLAELCEKLEYI